MSSMASSLFSVLSSANVTRESSSMPTTEPARLISLSSLEVSLLVVLPPPAHHSVEKDAGDHRLIKHPQEFCADVE